jgi:multicomponent Na+:H+ antiporter subunit E
LLRHGLTVLLLGGLWFLWSGHTEWLMLFFGLISVLFVAWIRARMERFAGTDDRFPLGLRWIPYLPWLLLEIVKSNLHVVGVILSPSLPVQPQLVRVRAAQRTAIGQVVYANSITLTPGTITLDVRDGEFLVHALTDVTAAGLVEGTMDRKCAALEGPNR